MIPIIPTAVVSIALNVEQRSIHLYFSLIFQYVRFCQMDIRRVVIKYNLDVSSSKCLRPQHCYSTIWRFLLSRRSNKLCQALSVKGDLSPAVLATTVVFSSIKLPTFSARCFHFSALSPANERGSSALFPGDSVVDSLEVTDFLWSVSYVLQFFSRCLWTPKCH